MEFQDNFRGRAVAAKVSERADEIYNQRKEVIDEGKMLSMTSEQKAEYQAKVFGYNREMRNFSWDDACRELGEGKIKVSLLFALKHEIQWRLFNVKKHRIMEKLRNLDGKQKAKSKIEIM